MVALNAVERRSLQVCTVLVLLATAARLGLAPGEAAYSWERASERTPSAERLARLRRAVHRNVELRRRAERPLAPAERIDPNGAPAVELERLPGIGPAIARAVVERRRNVGRFATVRELLDVPGIGPVRLRRILPFLGPEAWVRATAGPGGGSDGGGAAGRPAGAFPARSGMRPPAPPLDLNRATAAELAELPGVGPVLGRRIVEHRSREGRFGEVDDLLAVPGIGPERLARVRARAGVR